MGSWNPVQMYNIPSFWQGPVAQTGMSLLANMALAKLQHGMSMDVAKLNVEAEKQATGVAQGRKLEAQGALQEQKDVATQTRQVEKNIMTGNLVRIPEKELHTLPPEIQEQRVFWHNKKPYAVKSESPESSKPPSQKELLARSTTLRKEFAQQSKTFINVRDSFQRVEASVQNPSAAGDLSLIFNYMKMLDPESVVRESEFATAAATGSYGERLKAAAAKIIAGEKLSVAMRKDFEARARKLMQRQLGTHNMLRKSYTSHARAYGVGPSQVVTDYRMPFVTGKIYRDANGVQKKFLGNGQWGPVD